MTTKEYILNALRESPDAPVSGASMSRSLNLSRNAIWKTIETIKTEGYEIETIGKRGYLLKSDANVLTQAQISSLLNVKKHNLLPVRRLVSSTNKKAKSMALRGEAEHGTILVANAQHRGQGRFGKTFVSPANHGIYISFILDAAELPFNIPTLITPYAAVAVSEAIEETCKKSPVVKWVNDIFLDGKKICGILAEIVQNTKISDKTWIILGIGINVTPAKEHEKFPNVIGSIFDCDANDLPVTRNEIAAAVINRILNINYKQATIIEKYRQRLFIIGKKIRIVGDLSETPQKKRHTLTEEPKIQYVTVKDVTSTGELLVETETGEIKTLVAGEISLDI
ncbi:MAG: biotin--[acetyl-CoA-carboxylase] ligase [Defluviitaleaceae bacterium]|nr:biotin--[acetyl-CoA-carboxylase] ligase [Defluviitaleaceae bacterium]